MKRQATEDQTCGYSSANSGHPRAPRLARFNSVPAAAQHVALDNNDATSSASIQWSDMSTADLLPCESLEEQTLVGGVRHETAVATGANSARHEQRDDNQQFQIVMRNLSYQVDTRPYDKLFAGTTLASWWRLRPATRASKRMVLENLNGCVKSGEITAILGPSGVGKTSLLNALCGRTENYSGSIQLLGGGGSRARRMRSVIIPQKDYLISTLTVRESLHYASQIMNPKQPFDHQANVRRVVAMLNLSKCLHSSVSSISGGEHKRVSIAQELLSRPDILILDEPTSGLDSLSCKNLIKSLALLISATLGPGESPLAIVMTIHQPDIEVFNMFDRVYCLAHGGRVIYDGHPRDAMQVVRCHAQVPIAALDLRPATSEPETGALCMINPANLLIEIASGEYGSQPIERLARLQAKQFELQAAAQELQAAAECGQSRSSPTLDCKQQPNWNGLAGCKTSSCSVSASEASSEFGETVFKSEASRLSRDKRLRPTRNHQGNLFFYHTRLLAQRAFKATLRDPMISLVSLGFYLSIPLVMFMVFPSNIGTVRGCPLIVRDMETLSLASNRTLGIAADLQEQLFVSYECNAMFIMILTAFSMCSIAVAALTFPMNMHILLKETRNGWYGLSSFVTAESVASLPLQVFLPVVSIALTYWLLDMPSSPLQWRMWTLALVAVIHSLIGQANGLIFGALFMDSVQAAVFTGIASAFPQALMSGFTVRIKKMPRWLANLSYLSPFRYALVLFNMIRFDFGLCPCEESTNEYMRRQQPQFTDISTQVRSVFSYYLKNSNPVALGPVPANATSCGQQQQQQQHEKQQLVPGVYYGLLLDAGERKSILDKLESNTIDLFSQVAERMARSFSFGQPIASCQSVRSQLLNTFDNPQESEMLKILGRLLGLLIAARLILYFVIKFKIGSRV